MGCDIHPYLEVMFEGDWKFIGELPGHRNYQIFGVLSGVRDDSYNGELETCDYMEDIDGVSNELIGLYSDGYHSLGVGNLSILESIKENYPTEYARSFLPQWIELIKEFKKVPNFEAARVVVFYDN